MLTATDEKPQKIIQRWYNSGDLIIRKCNRFLPRDAMLARYMPVSVDYVRQSVTHGDTVTQRFCVEWLNIGLALSSQLTQHGSPETLVLRLQYQNLDGIPMGHAQKGTKYNQDK